MAKILHIIGYTVSQYSHYVRTDVCPVLVGLCEVVYREGS